MPYRTPRSTGSKGSDHINLRLPEDLAVKVRELAEKEERSVNAQLTRIVRIYLRRLELGNVEQTER